MKRVAFHTLGCKLNFAETSTIGRQFLRHDFEIVDADQPSNVFVLNTCSVTERADAECRQIVRRALRHSPDSFIVVIGCYAQLQPEAIGSIEGVDLVLGTKEKFNIFDYAGDFTKQSLPHVFVSCIDEAIDFTPAVSIDVGGRTRAFLKIQDGCDYSCTFCTIPHARGGSRSSSIKEIMQQARDVAARGYKEIVLTGVNVGDYGNSGNLTGTSLFDVMKQLETVDGIERIRISSIEPNLLTREMIDFVFASEKFCNHFHIPLQSGSDTILKQMRRRYKTNQYSSLIHYIKDNDPDAGIGADVIVGFPGETDELFEETYRFLVDLPVSYLHAFTYSERPGTPATEFAGSVEPKIRFKRNEMLRILSQKKRREFYSSFIGTTVDVLCESRVKHDRLSGLTKNYVRVEFPHVPDIINDIVPVSITGIEDQVCTGDIQQSLHHSGARRYRENATMFTVPLSSNMIMESQ